MNIMKSRPGKATSLRSHLHSQSGSNPAQNDADWWSEEKQGNSEYRPFGTYKNFQGSSAIYFTDCQNRRMSGRIISHLNQCEIGNQLSQVMKIVERICTVEKIRTHGDCFLRMLCLEPSASRTRELQDAVFPTSNFRQGIKVSFSTNFRKIWSPKKKGLDWYQVEIDLIHNDIFDLLPDKSLQHEFLDLWRNKYLFSSCFSTF